MASGLAWGVVPELWRHPSRPVVKWTATVPLLLLPSVLFVLFAVRAMSVERVPAVEVAAPNTAAPPPAGATQPEQKEEREADSLMGLRANPLNLDSNTASIKSGRQVRVADGGEVASTVAEIVGPLWDLTHAQRRRETAHLLGRRIAVAGRIGDIADYGNGTGFLYFAAPLAEPQVSAYLEEDTLSLLGSANIGDEVTITGAIHEVNQLEIKLRDVRVVEGAR